MAACALAGLAIISATILGALRVLDPQTVVFVLLAALGGVGLYHAPAPGQGAVPPALWVLSLGAVLGTPACYVSAPVTLGAEAPRECREPGRLAEALGAPQSATQLNFETQSLPLACPAGKGCLGVDAASGDLYYVDTAGVGTAIGAPPTLAALTAGTGLSGSPYDGTAARTFSVVYGTSGASACVGNDSRLSDARAPTAHASTHRTGQSDDLLSAPGIIGGGTAAAGNFTTLAGTVIAASTRLQTPTLGPDSSHQNTVPNVNGDTLCLLAASQTISGKSIGATQLTGTIDVARFPTGIPAPSIGGGAVDNTEFSALDGVTSGLQSQIDGKAPVTHGATHPGNGSDPVPNVVSSGASGLMTGTDKAKLDGIETAATRVVLPYFAGVLSVGANVFNAGDNWLISPTTATTAPNGVTPVFVAPVLLTANYLTCRISAPCGGGNSLVFTLQQSVDHGGTYANTSTVCSISGAADNFCGPIAIPSDLAVGGVVAFKAVNTNCSAFNAVCTVLLYKT